MNLDNFNNLVELFFYQTEKQKSENIFLEWLNPNDKKIFTWEETKQNILKSSVILDGRAIAGRVLPVLEEGQDN